MVVVVVVVVVVVEVSTHLFGTCLGPAWDRARNLPACLPACLPGACLPARGLRVWDRSVGTYFRTLISLFQHKCTTSTKSFSRSDRLKRHRKT